MNTSIVVVGSSNTDMVVKAERLPAPGETILGGTFFMNPGGKGANQAVAAARLGGAVTFICKTGNDLFGEQARLLFKKEGINTTYHFKDPEKPSGVALITLDSDGENCIVVASGANATLSPNDLEGAKAAMETAGIVLMQLEIPLNTVEYVAQIASGQGAKVVLNPAPACTLSNALLQHVSIITPNETEAEKLSGVEVNDLESAKKAARIIKEKGVRTVIITLGKKGALVFDEEEFTHVPGLLVKAVDTTAAGDVFNGALVVALAKGATLVNATAFACKAAAIAVTRMGAQSSAPYLHEIEEFSAVD